MHTDCPILQYVRRAAKLAIETLNKKTASSSPVIFTAKFSSFFTVGSSPLPLRSVLHSSPT